MKSLMEDMIYLRTFFQKCIQKDGKYSAEYTSPEDLDGIQGSQPVKQQNAQPACIDGSDNDTDTNRRHNSQTNAGEQSFLDQRYLDSCQYLHPASDIR